MENLLEVNDSVQSVLLLRSRNFENIMYYACLLKTKENLLLTSNGKQQRKKILKFINISWSILTSRYFICYKRVKHLSDTICTLIFDLIFFMEILAMALWRQQVILVVCMSPVEWLRHGCENQNLLLDFRAEYQCLPRNVTQFTARSCDSMLFLFKLTPCPVLSLSRTGTCFIYLGLKLCF